MSNVTLKKIESIELNMKIVWQKRIDNILFSVKNNAVLMTIIAKLIKKNENNNVVSMKHVVLLIEQKNVFVGLVKTFEMKRKRNKTKQIP
jgi:hypothetical protein